MSINAGSKTKLETEDLLASMVLQKLRKDMVFWPLLSDVSDRVRKGVKTVRIPRSLGRQVSNTPTDGTELTNPTTQYSDDVMTLNIHKTVYDYINDTEEAETMLDLKTDFYQDAPAALADAIEDEIIAFLVAGAANHLQFDGAGNLFPTLDQISNVNKLMTEAFIPKSNRYLAVSPSVLHEIRTQDGVADASKFGNNDAVVNGFVTKLHGFTVVESAGLASAQAIAFHSDAAVKALSRSVKRDEERQSSKKREFVSLDISYGRQMIRGGALAWLLNSAP
jgi:hypothetical protein